MPDFLQSFCPNADELLRRVSHHIDDALLYEIAAADYGNGEREHLIHLRRIRDLGLLDSPMRWHPREVLELIRWSMPEDPSWKPGLPGDRGHWMRAFACSALLRAGGEPADGDLRSGWNQTLIQLIHSLGSVGPELYRPCAAFLAWLIQQVKVDGDTEELGFLMVGLIWFALHLQITDDVIVSLSELSLDKAQHQSELDCGQYGQRWLLATTFHNLRHAGWRQLGRAFLEMDLSRRSSAVQGWVRLIGNELVGTS